MLYHLGFILAEFYGPFRLLSSHMFLIVLGTGIAFALTMFFIPRAVRFLPRDRGREFALQAEVSTGKPTGSGIVFVTVFVLVSLLVVPLAMDHTVILGLMYLAMVTGFLDDKSAKPWSEYLKAVLDLLIAVAGALVLIQSRTRTWLPFVTGEFTVPVGIFIPLAAGIIWISINSTNCTDGVDGLSSTLVLLGLISIGLFLYFILGHVVIAEYLLLPHYPDSARWAVMVFVLVGCLSGYLWFNAYPSQILMGDAGSRALGFFIGVVIVVARNPFLLLIVSSVILVNGGTGLVKVSLLRFFRIRVFHDIRFPLHDHFRNVAKWSNTQVLIRFSIIQILLIVTLFGIFIKVR
ncbi:MAG: phospho-N-acetylmuramoyl-pentapeptide-transferase [Spirochaetaceae bacterium]|nr:MAG: phospho-N-acetylmuramoyl-pentapeptide-transferase [Spirochaetaceae bacterium]